MIGNLPESWATPQASDHVEGRRTDLNSNQKCLGRDMKMIQAYITQNYPNRTTRTLGKLNSRWIEVLMGLPVGWTMPSCTHPIFNPANVATISSVESTENTTEDVRMLSQIASKNDSLIDELRLLGNGVVPSTAEKGFVTLWKSLMKF